MRIISYSAAIIVWSCRNRLLHCEKGEKSLVKGIGFPCQITSGGKDQGSKDDMLYFSDALFIRVFL